MSDQVLLRDLVVIPDTVHDGDFVLTLARGVQDKWLKGRTFLLVPYHLPDSQSLDAAILGGYVAHVAKEYKGAALPAVYRDDSLIADAAQLRQQVSDDKFIALLPATGQEAQEWGSTGWDTASLNRGLCGAAGRPGAPSAGR